MEKKIFIIDDSKYRAECLKRIQSDIEYLEQYVYFSEMIDFRASDLECAELSGCNLLIIHRQYKYESDIRTIAEETYNCLTGRISGRPTTNVKNRAFNRDDLYKNLIYFVRNYESKKNQGFDDHESFDFSILAYGKYAELERALFLRERLLTKFLIQKKVDLEIIEELLRLEGQPKEHINLARSYNYSQKDSYKVMTHLLKRTEEIIEQMRYGVYNCI